MIVLTLNDRSNSRNLQLVRLEELKATLHAERA